MENNLSSGVTPEGTMMSVVPMILKRFIRLFAEPRKHVLRLTYNLSGFGLASCSESARPAVFTLPELNEPLIWLSFRSE